MEGDPLLNSVTANSTRNVASRIRKRITLSCMGSIVLSIISVIAIVFTIFRFTENPSLIPSTNNNIAADRRSNVGHEIRNGQDCDGDDYPWIASWRFKTGTHCCTGSLIHQSPPIILTAEHCIACKKEGTVDIGRTFTEKKDKKDNYDSFKIGALVPHPTYDIMMVVLQGITDRATIPLVDPLVDKEDNFAQGTEVDIYGYGYVNAKDSVDSTHLQSGKITYWTKDNCYKQLDEQCNSGLAWDYNQMMCGWDSDESTEAGDSGGPAVVGGQLVGVNSWSPNKCTDKRILDVFVDVGSVRHWIEDNKPTSEKYIVALHVCNAQKAMDLSLYRVSIYGSSTKSYTWPLDYAQREDDFYVFRFNINNIGWRVEGIEFVPYTQEPLCIDSVVAGRLDSPQLFSGNADPFWIDAKSVKIDLQHDDCATGNNMIMAAHNEDGKDEELSEKKAKKTSAKKTKSSKKTTKAKPTPPPTLPPIAPIDDGLYTVIVHVCNEKKVDSKDSFYARLNLEFGSTEWIEFGTSKGLDQDGLYIFYVDAQKDIGSLVESVDFASIGSDSTCIDMVTAGQTNQPNTWRGSDDELWMDSPCADGTPVDECYQYQSVLMSCYRYD